MASDDKCGQGECRHGRAVYWDDCHEWSDCEVCYSSVVRYRAWQAFRDWLDGTADDWQGVMADRLHDMSMNSFDEGYARGWHEGLWSTRR